MPGVWAQSSEGRWQSLTSTGFVSEAEFHDLMEQAPTMLPLAGTFGNVSRGALHGPGSFNLDTSLFKRVALKETVNLQFRAEFFNVLNHANFDTPNPIIFSGTGPNASAGVITETANRERQIQFALKILF